MVWSLLDILGVVLRRHEAWALEHPRQDNSNTEWESGIPERVVVALWMCELPVGPGGGD